MADLEKEWPHIWEEAKIPPQIVWQESSDFVRGEKGIKVAIISTGYVPNYYDDNDRATTAEKQKEELVGKITTQLQKAGLDKETASKTIENMGNIRAILHSDRSAVRTEMDPLVVVKDHNSKPIRVYSASPNVVRVDGKEPSVNPDRQPWGDDYKLRYTLNMRVDPATPDEPVKLDGKTKLETIGPNDHVLSEESVNIIQKSLPKAADKKLGMNAKASDIVYDKGAAEHDAATSAPAILPKIGIPGLAPVAAK